MGIAESWSFNFPEPVVKEPEDTQSAQREHRQGTLTPASQFMIHILSYCVKGRRSHLNVIGRHFAVARNDRGADARGHISLIYDKSRP